ncbi:hypothetical protein MVEN_02354500 [Mycena venus]|uniref:Uncharacterized protein n=1 Tax=Mycena venus TaxID=2733690 RepID=A0A8H7CFC5_9AGAR|nr:hypothetical protein MVEN_02354500 [Mycena venus]
MFSKILILGLSALSIVSAIPTEQTAQNKPLKTPALYNIFQPAAKGSPYLYKYLRVGPEEETPLHMSDPIRFAPYQPMWWVRSVGEDEFTLEPYGNDWDGLRAAAYVPSPPDDPSLVIGSRDETLNSVWAIESAGEDAWVVKVPGANSVWKSTWNSTVNLAGADGTANEHWNFIYFGDHYHGP